MRNIFRKWHSYITNCFTGDKIMYATSISDKPRRKIVDVPIHRHQNENEPHQTTRKTFKNNSRRHRHRSSERREKTPLLSTQENSTELPDDNEEIRKISKKHLFKENLLLAKEKEEIISKFNELEDLSVKKITKLREKISGIQNEKLEIEAENLNLKTRINGLLTDYEEIRNQLDLCKICHGCEEFKASLEKFSNENTTLRKCNQDLTEDLNMLKTVVYRLNVQLERYQEKLRKINITDTLFKNPNIYAVQQGSGEPHFSPEIFKESHADHQHIPVSWGSVNSHTLGPLLEGFEDTINEKDEIISEYEKELSDFTGKYKEILSENERLHLRLTEDDQCSIKLTAELKQLRIELQNCKEQNDSLIKKCALKQDKIEEILKIYESKVEQLKRDYNVLHDQYYKCRNELASLNEKNKALIDNQEEFKNEKKNCIPIAVHTASVNECKKWYEELKLQYEKEKEKLNLNNEMQAKDLAELRSRISFIQREKDEREDKIKQLEKHIRKGETKYLELEQALHEAQVSRTACKKQLHKVMNFAKDLVTEQETLLKALNQRQQENKVVTKIGADMATRMDSLKTHLKEVQRGAWQELNTVEGKIQEQEQTIEQMKEDYEKEMKRLKEIINQQSNNAVLVKAQSNLPLSPYILFRDKLQN